MSENQLISFIIPALNAENTIGACLESVQNLDYPKNLLEIIVVDNGSKDNTRAIAGRFTSKILINDTATIAKLRNAGAKNATGEFIIFLDSDCVIPADWIKNALGHFNDNSVGLVGTKICKLPDNANWIDKTWETHLYRGKAQESARWLRSCAAMVRKDIFIAMGGFDESLTTCEDVEFGYRMQKQHRIIADKRLAPLHLNGHESILKFFKKESWRGRGSLRVGLKNLHEPKEALTIAVLFYYFVMLILLLPAICVAVMTKNLAYPVAIFFGVILPLFLASFIACIRAKNFGYLGKFFIIYAVYIIARIVAVFR